LLQPRSTLFPYTTLFRSRHSFHQRFSERARNTEDPSPDPAEGQRLMSALGDDRVARDLLMLPRLLRRAGVHVNAERARVYLQARSEEHTSELQSRVDLVC